MRAPSLTPAALIVALAALGALPVRARAQADWPEFYVPPPPPPEWSVTLQMVFGPGYDASVQGVGTDAFGAGFELLVRRRMLLVGAFVDAVGSTGTQGDPSTDPAHPGYGGHEGIYLGAAAGVAWEPLRWARLQLLAQGGVHQVSVESNFVEPSGNASLPFLGVKAGAGAFTDLNPEVLGMRRIGVVLQVDLRVDLGSDTIRAGVPAGFAPAPELAVGGLSCVASFGMALEW